MRGPSLRHLLILGPLLVASIIAVVAARTQTSKKKKSSGTPPFLVPLLPFGLSNQVIALKEALALAAVLGWPVVSYGFMPHYTEVEAAAKLTANGTASGEAEPGAVRAAMIPYDTIFDRQALAPIVTVLELDDAVRQYGWGTRPDVVLAIGPLSLKATANKLADEGVLDLRNVRVLRKSRFMCNTSGLDWLRKKARGARWVALYSYNHVVPRVRSWGGSYANDSTPCGRAYHQVTLRMGKSPTIAAIARDFVAAAMSQAEPAPASALRQEAGTTATAVSDAVAPAAAAAPPTPYIALHVRPYPDTCLDYFVAMESFEAAAAAGVCENPLLLEQMVPLVRQAVAAWRGDGHLQAPPPPVFVMSHPRVRDVVRRELRRLWAVQAPTGGAVEANGTAALPLPPPALHFLDVADLPFELRHQVAANSLLSVVEQEVCRTAALFIGTPASSISVLVAQERSAAAAEAEVGVVGGKPHGAGRVEQDPATILL